LVRTSLSDEPACGSDRHIVPVNRPSSIGLANLAICSSVPWVSSSEAFAMVSSG
jgi:hypothetical protein